jgi:YesN/AraC family two-component response regulator
MHQVLLVDDDDIVRRVLGAAIRRRGVEVTEARSGVHALSLASNHRFHGAILDLILPQGMDGLETMVAIRKIHPPIPFLFITGHGTVPIAVRAMQLGAFHFFEKPIDPDTFILSLLQAIKLPVEGETGSKYVTRAVNIVNSRFANATINIETIAKELGISSDYLGRLFSRSIGKSLLDCLHEVRITEAVTALSDPSQSIKQIVTRCGYHSHSELDAHFGKIKGCSPSEWRRRLKSIGK